MKLLIIISIMVGTCLAAFQFPDTPQMQDRMGNSGPDRHGGPVGYGQGNGGTSSVGSERKDNGTETGTSEKNEGGQGSKGDDSGKESGVHSLYGGVSAGDRHAPAFSSQEWSLSTDEYKKLMKESEKLNLIDGQEG